MRIVEEPAQNDKIGLNHQTFKPYYYKIQGGKFLNNIATTVVDKMEFSGLNKIEKSIEETMIKSSSLKLKEDRFGKIKKISR